MALQIADLYAGAGGTTTGIEDALLDLGLDAHIIAVNHWDVAIATHRENHKTAKQFLTDLDTTRPIDLVPGGYLDLLWASPECTFFSRARGGKPVSDQQRMSPWTVIRWLTDLDVQAVLVENVPEFVDWGPVGVDGKPIKQRKGQYFNAWIRNFQDLGYEVGYRMLNAADYGDATTRKRFFLQARKDEQALRWPEATHSRAATTHMLGSTHRWRPAAEIIDWSNPGPSLFERKKELSIKTRLRIARGLARFAGPLAPFYIRLLDLPAEEEARFVGREADGYAPFVTVARSNNVPKAVTDPLGTITTMPGIGLVQPAAFTVANRNNNAARSTDDPIAAVTTSPGGGGIAKVETAAFVLAQGGGGEARPVDEPAPTIVGKGALSLTSAAIVEYYGNSDVSDAEAPLPTITVRDRFALASFVTKHHGASDAGSIDEPLGAITTRRKHGLASPFITKHRGTGGAESVEEPLTTVTAGGNHHSVVTPDALVVPYGPRAEATPSSEALPTILTKDRLGLATPEAIVVGYQGREDATRSTDDPLSTVTAGGKRHGLLTPAALSVTIDQGGMAGKGVRSAEEPLPTLVTKANQAVATPAAFALSRHSADRGRAGRPTEEPLPVITARGGGYLVRPEAEAFIVPRYGERNGQQPRVHDTGEPLPTIPTTNQHQLVSPTALVLQMAQVGRQDNGTARAVAEPLPAVTTHNNLAVATATPIECEGLEGVDPRRLIVVDGQVYLLDIYFRMFFNEELAAATGFPQRYRFCGTKAEVTAQIGNAVPPKTVKALVVSLLSPSARKAVA